MRGLAPRSFLPVFISRQMLRCVSLLCCMEQRWRPERPSLCCGSGRRRPCFALSADVSVGRYAGATTEGRGWRAGVMLWCQGRNATNERTLANAIRCGTRGTAHTWSPPKHNLRISLAVVSPCLRLVSVLPTRPFCQSWQGLSPPTPFLAQGLASDRY